MVTFYIYVRGRPPLQVEFGPEVVPFWRKIEANWPILDQNWKQLGPHGHQEPLLRIPVPNDPSSLVRFGPILGPSWGLSWAYVAPCVVKKCLKTHFESMLFPNTIFKGKFGLLEPLLDTKNQAKTWEGCQNSRFSAFHQKWFWGGILGPLLGGFWALS